MRVSLMSLLCAVALFTLTPLGSIAHGVIYESADWPESGFGNHRVRLEVAVEHTQADAVRVEIPWRRRDADPQNKALLLYDQAGEPVTDLFAVTLQAEQATLLFRPRPGQQTYYLYYLPYVRVGMFESESYLPPVNSADPNWLAGIDRQHTPEARAVALQSRGDFHSFYPMEVVATEAETQALAHQHPQADFLIFPEDRTHAIRMFDRLPLRWIEQGPANHFALQARPGEYRVFQLGLWAHQQALAPLKLQWTDLIGERGQRIPADQMTCFNTEGRDIRGERLTKDVSVPAGRVQPMWMGVQIPADARGSFTTTLNVQDAAGHQNQLQLKLEVSGDLLADGGVADLESLSRLQWLNSTRGLEDQVPSAFDPVQVRENQVHLRHRSIRLAESGLPASIVSQNIEILAAPMQILAETASGRLPLSGVGHPQVTHTKQFEAEHRHTASFGNGVSAQIRTVTEADGCIQFWIDLDAREATHLDAIKLHLPIRKEVATYWMGMEKRGGYRSGALDWTWKDRYINNLIWVGEVNAGVQLKLQSADDTWALWALPLDPAMLWSQGGAGGCRSIETDDALILEAYTGAIHLEPGNTQSLRFRLLITPFKEIDNRHWRVRIQDAVASAENTVFHLHHGSYYMPYINYPFTNMDRLKGFVEDLAQPRTLATDRGRLSIPLPETFDPQSGALHAEVTVNFDSRDRVPGSDASNQPLMTLELGEQIGRLGFYWNTDDSGMRAFFQQGTPHSPVYPAQVWGTAAEYRPGDRHMLSVSWGKELAIHIDGQFMGSSPFQMPTSDTRPVLNLEGSGFTVRSLRLDAPSAPAGPTPLTDSEESLLLLDFTANAAMPSPHLTFRGPHDFQENGLRLLETSQTVPGREAQIYYTVRELSNHAAELWAFRSLGEEIFTTQEGLTYAEMGAFSFGAGGGYPWLQEHLVDGYVPAWRTTWLPEAGLPGDFCAAITTRSDSRLINYYVESTHWLFRELNMQGLYLDGIGYGREVTQRIARTLSQLRPDYRINAHCSDLYELDRISVMNQIMEHLPYMTDLWIGEFYNYGKSPDFYLIEISGIPFGLTNEMLNYENGGNPYRGMIYGMSGRFLPDAAAMWRFWDSFGIDQARMVGYWDPHAPVRADHPDIKATTYVKDDQALIALAQWSSGVGQSEKTIQVPILRRGQKKAAAQLSRFIDYTNGGLMPAAEQTVVEASIRPDGLQFDFICYQTAPIRAQSRDHDGPVWEDDAIEFFIQPIPGSKQYYQFIVNAAGARFDAQQRDATWNGRWTSETRPIPGGWAGTVHVPWTTLGMTRPQAGEIFAANICRNHGNQPSSWTLPDGSFHNTSAFARVQATDIPSHATHEPLPTAEETAAVYPVHLAIDPNLFPNFDPNRYHLHAPAIASFQEERFFALGDPIPVETGKGWLLWLKPK